MKQEYAGRVGASTERFAGIRRFAWIYSGDAAQR